MHADFVVALGGGALAALLSWCYFRRYQVTRPPIGVFNLRDVAILLAAIVLVPYVYLHLPLGLVAGLLALTTASIIYFTLEPVLRRRRLAPAIALCAAGADVALAVTTGAMSNAFLAVNDALMVIVVVGVANLWAQSGMGAREVALLAGALAVYDFVATSQLTLMTDLIGRLDAIPFVPFVAWDARGGGLGVGLGDLLLISVFPLAMRKSFGRPAGAIALGAGVGVLAAVLGAVASGVLDGAIPVMVALGPVMLAQYAFWSRRAPQRTTFEYLQAEPLGASRA